MRRCPPQLEILNIDKSLLQFLPQTRRLQVKSKAVQLAWATRKPLEVPCHELMLPDMSLWSPNVLLKDDLAEGFVGEAPVYLYVWVCVCVC